MATRFLSRVAHATIAITLIPLVTALPLNAVTVTDGSAVSSSSGCQQISGPSQFTTTLFVEDFCSYAPGSQPSRDKWTYSLGHNYPGGDPDWGTQEVDTNTDFTDNVVITSDRTLRITPLYNKASNTWTSSRIESIAAHDFACAPGKQLLVQGRILLRSGTTPGQLGIWPAFWLLGSAFRGNPTAWHSIGEVDILESVNGASQVWQTVHCGVSPGGPCHEKTGVGNKGNTGLTRNVWHTLGVRIDRTNSISSSGQDDWRGETITFLVDGVESISLDGGSINDEAGWNAIIRNSKYFIMNVAVGGELPDGVSGKATPTGDTQGGVDTSMKVAWVGAWST